MDYVDSIIAKFHGKYYEFWEFAHLLWRPLGWAITQTIAFLSPNWVESDSMRYHSMLTLVSLSWLAGLLTLYFFHRMATFLVKSFWWASLSTIGMATAQAFLNFTQAGTSYMAGLCMLVLAIYIFLAPDNPDGTVREDILGGIVLAVSVFFWFPYILTIPAVLLVPVIVRRSMRSSLIGGLSLGTTLGVVWLAVIFGLRFHTVGEVLAWVRASSHGVQIRGVSRAVFGFSRSFINMGDDGVLFKRYLLHDPFNPVSPVDLVRIVLVKLLLFYSALASLFWALIIVRKWRVLVLLLAGTVPVLLFAIRFDGGAWERYLPLYPFLFLALAVVLSERSTGIQHFVCLAFLIAMAFINVTALSRHATALREAALTARVSSIPSFMFNEDSLLYVTHNGDGLVSFARSFPWAPLNRNKSLHVRTAVAMGGNDLPVWKSTFGASVLAAWDKRGSVWVSQRFFSHSPQADWNWAEHDDPRISWNDLNLFFSSFVYGQCVGASDGFCLLIPSASNRQLLVSLLPTRQGEVAP